MHGSAREGPEPTPPARRTDERGVIARAGAFARRCLHPRRDGGDPRRGGVDRLVRVGRPNEDDANRIRADRAESFHRGVDNSGPRNPVGGAD